MCIDPDRRIFRLDSRVDIARLAALGDAVAMDIAATGTAALAIVANGFGKRDILEMETTDLGIADMENAE